MSESTTSQPATTASRAVRFCVDINALTDDQARLFAMHGGGARQIYNWGLARRNEQQDWIWAAARAAAFGDPAFARKLLSDKKWRTAALVLAPPHLRDVSKAALSRAFTTERDPKT